MGLENKSEHNNELVLGIIIGIIAIGGLFGYFWVKYLVKDDPYLLKKWPKKKRFFLFLEGVFWSTLAILLSVFLAFSYSLLFLIALQIPVFLLTFLGLFYAAESFFKKEISLRISEKHLFKEPKRELFSQLEEKLLEADSVPIGVSKVTNLPVVLPRGDSVKHIAIAGGTGEGKTGLSLSLQRYDLCQGVPIITIDPKADIEDIELARKNARLSKREEDFKLFSTSFPSESLTYNAIKLGDAVSKAEKTIYAFELVHAHYGPLASSILVVLFETLELLKISPSLDLLETLVTTKSDLMDLFERVRDLPETKQSKKLLMRLGKFQKIKDEDISGLRAALSKLNSSAIGAFINPLKDREEVDLERAIRENWYLYIDVNPNEHTDQYRQISKFLYKDLEILSARMQKNKSILKHKYIGLHFEEFDTFVNDKFHLFLKVARSVRMALTMSFQSVSGLDVIGTHLKQQLATNTVAFLQFSTSAEEDLEYISKLPGTLKTKEQSQQIDKKKFKNTTGMGTEFTSEVFKIDPNLVRELKMDQFFLYDKSKVGSDRIDLVSGFSSKKYASISRPIEIIRSIKNKKINFKNIHFRNWNREVGDKLALSFRDKLDLLDYDQREIVGEVYQEWRMETEENALSDPWKVINP